MYRCCCSGSGENAIPPVEPPAPVVEGVKDWGMPGPEPKGANEWAALRRLLERKDPSYKD